VSHPRRIVGSESDEGTGVDMEVFGSLTYLFIAGIPVVIAWARGSRYTLWVVLIAVFFTWSVLGWFIALALAFGKKKGSDSDSTRVAMLEGDGSFSFADVVGESHYRENLVSIIQKAPREQRDVGEVFWDAVLMPEPNNPFDPRAIMVGIDGKVVGYIARDTTDVIHEAIRTVQEMGYTDMACRAVIGWSPKEALPPIGVRLDIVQSEDS
jgi:hypothetical protein